MNFGKIFERKKNDAQSNNLEEIYKIKEEIEKEDKIFEKELPSKYTLLQEFSMDQLKKLCHDILGREPPTEEYTDQMNGNEKVLPQFKEDYVHFITDELNFSEIKNYAVKNKIVTEEFFRS
ncbi:MAG: hypothetical protein KGI25_06970 [Thaumarchaeota archaeon]|nr:hypothetical protein [Nitrososphaerota archaeon]